MLLEDDRLIPNSVLRHDGVAVPKGVIVASTIEVAVRHGLGHSHAIAGPIVEIIGSLLLGREEHLARVFVRHLNSKLKELHCVPLFCLCCCQSTIHILVDSRRNRFENQKIVLNPQFLHNSNEL